MRWIESSLMPITIETHLTLMEWGKRMILQKYKIVFGGPLGSGKTNSIQSLTEVSMLSIDAINPAKKSDPNKVSSVNVEYAEIELDEGLIVGLYAIPTSHLDLIGAKLCKDAVGAVILIDHSLKSAVEDLEYYVDAFKKHLSNIVIGVTHLDEDPQQLLKKYRNWISMRSETLPLFAIDARQKDDVLILIEALIARAEQE